MNERAKAEQELRERNKLRFMSYQDFLNTPFWKKARTNALTEAGHRCRLCNTLDDLRVHHRIYENRGWEDRHPEDLTVLCDPCHKKYHDLVVKPKESNKPVKKKIYDEPHFGGGDVTNCRPMTDNELHLFREYRRKQGRPIPEPQTPTPKFNSYWDSFEERQREQSIEEIEMNL